MEDLTRQEQASPEVQARIRAGFDRQGLMGHLGARITHIAPGRVHIVLPSRPEVTQQHGYIHAPAVGDHIEAVGTVLKSGRTLTVCRLEVFGVRDGRRSLVANGQQTLIRVNSPES